jgi:hypothetical protein
MLKASVTIAIRVRFERSTTNEHVDFFLYVESISNRNCDRRLTYAMDGKQHYTGSISVA